MPKVVVLDDSVSRRHRAFLERHKVIMDSAPEMEVRANQSTQAVVALYARLESIEEAPSAAAHLYQCLHAFAEAYSRQFGRTPELLKPHVIALVERVWSVLERHLVSVRSCCQEPAQAEACLESLLATSELLLRLLEQVPGRLRQDLEAGRWRHLRNASGQLLKMAKYFGKLRLQLATREQGRGAAVADIRDFLARYEKYEQDCNFFDPRARGRLEAEMGRFKDSVEQLKLKVRERAV